MKIGFFGGTILLILTLVFASMAIESDRMTKQIVAERFGLNKPKQSEHTQQQVAPSGNQSVGVQQVPQAQQQQEQVQKDDKWAEFDKKFENFDEKFKNF